MLRIVIALVMLCMVCVVNAQEQPQNTMPKYEKGLKKNPFIPIITNEGQLINIEDDEDKEVQFNLEGIIFDKEGQSIAIINGQILGKNETILDAKIVDVRKDSVVYVKDGEIFVLNLKKEE
jgi:type II secretory pathway component PulC